MVVEYPLYSEPCTLGITIGTNQPTKISLIVEDADKFVYPLNFVS